LLTCTRKAIHLPAIDGKPSLDDESVSLPTDTKGKFTLIGVAFSEDAQNDLYTWGVCPCLRFILGRKWFECHGVDVNVQLVPLIYRKLTKRLTTSGEND